MLPHGTRLGLAAMPRPSSATKCAATAMPVSSRPSRPRNAVRRSRASVAVVVALADGERDAAGLPLGRARGRARRARPGAARPTRPGAPAGPGSRRCRPPRSPGCSATPTRCWSSGLLGPVGRGLVQSRSAARPRSRRARRSGRRRPSGRAAHLHHGPTLVVAVRPSPFRRRARTQTRRGRRNSEPHSPMRASTTPASAIRLPGDWLIWTRTHGWTPSKLTEPEAVGQLLGLAEAQVEAQLLAVGLLDRGRPCWCRAGRPTAARRCRGRGRRSTRSSRSAGCRGPGRP